MPSLFQRIYSKIVGIGDRLLVKKRIKGINNTDFSIICNNCWGGYVYRRYGLPYRTPTVGLYFFADDFIKLCAELKSYMSMSLRFISYKESKYSEILEERKHTKVPLARLGDIEIVFLHYETEEEAAEKWYRRVERINYDNLIIKFSKMNGCTDEHLRQFNQYDFSKKICFVPKYYNGNIKSGICFKSANGNKEVNDDTCEYSRYINITKMINSKKVCGSHMEGTWEKK